MSFLNSSRIILRILREKFSKFLGRSLQNAVYFPNLSGGIFQIPQEVSFFFHWNSFGGTLQIPRKVLFNFFWRRNFQNSSGRALQITLGEILQISREQLSKFVGSDSPNVLTGTGQIFRDKFSKFFGSNSPNSSWGNLEISREKIFKFLERTSLNFSGGIVQNPCEQFSLLFARNSENSSWTILKISCEKFFDFLWEKILPIPREEFSNFAGESL